MPSELEELAGFLNNPNAQIRLAAAENLVPYSTAEPSVFKKDNLTPIKHLKILTRDHTKIAEHVFTMLINLSGDAEVLDELAKDDKFLGIIFGLLVDPEEPNANLIAMLFANLAKWDGFKDILKRKQPAPEALGSDDSLMNQLMDLFVKGQDGAFNKKADFDYLAYAFADLAKHPEVRTYFVKPQDYDGVIPITKLKVFTEHKSEIRRKGVASTIKNAAFDVNSHPALLSDSSIDILPYILLPITGNEEYDVDDTLEMLPDLQLLSPDKKRDSDAQNVQTHVETLMILTTTREGRDLMRRVKVYPIVKETHMRVNDDGVREACDRLVQVLMRDEEGEDGAVGDDATSSRVVEVQEDEEEQIVEV